MKIKLTIIKRLLLGLLLFLAGYQLMILASSILSKPENLDLKFQPINQAIMQTSIKDNLSDEPIQSPDFEYEVIGYRAGAVRASIIVKRNNKSYVVQQGELLENKYKLISVDVDSAIFEYMGEKYELKTSLINAKK
ncbi:MAG: hypothetical protein ABR63_06355 [SAR86 cluster bacterium BACL1 MAG-120920-bin57]|mgnify:FL=1|jgi:hypothetical protein|uniref:Uncharacterized protein n=1 Tax=SAR86 cluster bacterium BACL1 MAG-120920-bin57 TaxID=1655571 RepID=A0A0R2PRY7_9GAMM|nr:MAG: hypothetical protein ABR63_06355 [SAR86 cluster bacterium BACL1 MAG-120920-bin57]KRO98590.1 MAG: hypothetical protein ABS15_07695 [SAR86 cluster bacterium BACL1 MAG-120823-bin87]KRP01636.1 MAG: hypothetical protein ABS09_07905 [SAR86 cluster bacterium BACL1 MAG-120619-bin26]KRP15259.1 MAG: hypothetical protein ABS18_03945 [SAR86 cluster bacterium BACL1 MAG-121001-bin56]KRP15718.1 MAG: hypothetical protein ABS13_01130 [SAR86 cluster bacterium BACL1 MAG-121128-bin56]KRP20279.1 MAG: hypot